MMLLAAALALAATMAACGDSDETAGASPLSKAEFVKRTNAACKRERAGLKKRVSFFLEQPAQDGKPAQVLNADLAHFVLLPTIEAEIVRIEELWEEPGVPSNDDKRIDLMLDAERQAIDDVATTSRIASIKAVELPFARAGRLFRAYGLSSCANGPQPGKGV
jgi:hypothetical protein